MSVLLIGFDSAWTKKKIGAIVGAIVDDAGAIQDLGVPTFVKLDEAAEVIRCWQAQHAPSSTLVLIDQPTIVRNATGQRPVERIVCSIVSRRRGGMQPAHTNRTDMFGSNALIWSFLDAFGGAADPLGANGSTRILETYPVLAIISLACTLTDPERPGGRLPKYNPERRHTFSLADWVHVCHSVASRLRTEGVIQLAEWVESAARNAKPVKGDQDRLDACICLLVAIHLARSSDTLIIGNCATGYVVVPDSELLRRETAVRCREIGHGGDGVDPSLPLAQHGFWVLMGEIGRLLRFSDRY